MNNVVIGSNVVVPWYTGMGMNSLYLTRDGGATWELLIQIPGTNDPEDILSYNWIVSGAASNNCFLRVIDEFDSEIIITNKFSICNRTIKQTCNNSGIGIFI